MSTSTLPVVVIGAGPVGLAAATHLRARGLRPLVLEAGPSAIELIDHLGLTLCRRIVELFGGRLHQDWSFALGSTIAAFAQGLYSAHRFGLDLAPSFAPDVWLASRVDVPVFLYAPSAGPYRTAGLDRLRRRHPPVYRSR